MFLWAEHPSLNDLTPFIQRLAKRDVLLMPGSSFSTAEHAAQFIRINVSHFAPKHAELFRL